MLRVFTTRLLVVAAITLAAASWACAETTSPLFGRGYTVIPEPQRVSLRSGDFIFASTWGVQIDKSVRSNDVAVETLREDLASRFNLRLAAGGSSTGVVSLKIAPGSVQVGNATDKNKDQLAKEAYRIELGGKSIQITANAEPGLFYGVETLVQLLRRHDGALWLPEGTIEDWPDLELRHIYWDDAHHLDRLDELKKAVRQAAFYKINGFTIKLEGHFQFKSAPALVEPQALTPAQFQELTDYGLRYHIQVIPYLDGPAHIAFILKHPEYAKLREYPNSNYELCVANPDSYKLLEGMFKDLMDANKGGKYFYVSTDEAYYIGLANNAQCNEAQLAQKLGSVGKLFAEFVTKAGGYIHDQGRTVMFWGEYPMKPDDLQALPSFVVNGEVYGPDFDPIYRKQGIRQMIYTSSEGEEKLFPEYFTQPASDRLHGRYSATARLRDTFDKISFDSSRHNSDLIGEINAGWGDMGLHPETFWLGYIGSGSAAWHPGSPHPGETISTFYPLFYGSDVVDMDRVYQLLSTQAQFWTDSWDDTESKARKPIWGNSYAIYDTPHPAHDQTLPLPPAPNGQLDYTSEWSQENAKRLDLTSTFLQQNETLMGLLGENIRRVQLNRYNLEVYMSIARLCRQNLDMLNGIHQMDSMLRAASRMKSRDPKQAVAELDRALEIADSIREDRNQVLKDTEATWYKSWMPRVAEANGRRFLHEVDDVKDHLPDRTVDMSYLVYREKLLPFGDWVKAIASARNEFAAAHQLPATNERFDWDDLSVTRSAQQ